jgi:hypothetical protein
MCPAETKPANHWYHISLAVIFAGLWAYWRLYRFPPPNKAVLAMAAMVALMMLVDMKRVHKGIYFLLVIGFFFLENHAIDKERTDSKKETEKVAKNFEAIADKLKESSDWITGGDAKVTVMADARLQLEVISGGPQPVRDVYLNIFDPRRPHEAAKQIHIPIVYTKFLQHWDYVFPVTDESTSFQVDIHQPNMSCIEEVKFAKEGSRWIPQPTEPTCGKRLTP